MGHSDTDSVLKTENAKLKTDINKKPGRTHFVKACAYKRDGELFVESLQGQGSHMMSSMASANCFLVLPKDEDAFLAGTEQLIHWLP